MEVELRKLAPQILATLPLFYRYTDGAALSFTLTFALPLKSATGRQQESLEHNPVQTARTAGGGNRKAGLLWEGEGSEGARLDD